MRKNNLFINLLLCCGVRCTLYFVQIDQIQAFEFKMIM